MTVDLSGLRAPVIAPGLVFDSRDAVEDRAKALFELLELERARLAKIDLWAKGVQEIPQVRDAEPEMQKLLELARTPVLPLVSSTIAQALFVDGFKTADGKTVDAVWDIWLANGMPARQTALYRAALDYGYCYTLLSKGTRPIDGKPTALIQGLSPKRAYAVYDDPAFDLWPQYAIVTKRMGERAEQVVLYDSVFAHTFVVKESTWTYRGSDEHGAGRVPLVRYAPRLDLDGNAVGEIEPFIGLAARIDKTVFDRLLTQHYNSWKKIYIAGLKKPSSQSEAERAKLKLRQADMMMFEDKDTKVGTLPETSLEGFIKAIESDIDELSAMAQVPAYLFNGGNLSNLGADTIVAANKPFTQKIFERQVALEEANNQTLRLAAYLSGEMEAASDLRSHVTWQDIDVRSFAQAADALGKFVQVLGVPKTAMWRKIPNVTETEAQEWENLAMSDDPVERMLFEREQSAKGPTVTPSEDVEENGDPSPEESA